MPRQKTLVLATHNIHKRKEMNQLLAELDVNIVGLDQFPDIGDIKIVIKGGGLHYIR